MRREGWEGRLFSVMEEAGRHPFELGTHDCFRLACRVVEALTGVDRWPEFAPYATRREELEQLARYGATFEAAMDWFFGAPAVSTRYARRGDVVCRLNPDGEQALGVCLGAEAAFLVPEGAGLLHLPTLTCLYAWRVG